MKLTSSAFDHTNIIPSRYTCDGENINPPLEIIDTPKNAKSLVLIMDDPDVPAKVREDKMWVHWVVFNIKPTITTITQNSKFGTQGKGSYTHMNYGGPCPPPQYEPTEHRYFFKLYALDIFLDLPQGATKEMIENAMQGHIIEKTELMGKYDRS